MENKRGGFTLVEVMTVILLFGMLMLLIFPMRRMMVRVLERTGDQEHAEMIGDAVFRHVTDGLQTGAIRVGELDELSLDTFCEDDLVPEISVEDSSESRVFIRITVSEGARVLYERSGNIFCGSPGQQP
ncbi:MAG: type II secretion system protein [Clostridiales bacterium]|mgnify:FL=1|nr:type II secretion system protein [Clostridium sp. Marseille-P7770]MBD9228277.1 type II secretion system protein [Clostridiales bacterium]